MWVRGLKPTGYTLLAPRFVAPYVGAWIETNSVASSCIRLRVAPYVGAWIETRVQLSLYEQRMSHPMWVRGLKLTRFIT